MSVTAPVCASVRFNPACLIRKVELARLITCNTDESRCGWAANKKRSGIGNDKLFIKQKDARLLDGFDTGIIGRGGAIQAYLADHYVSTVRDMRRTYQRVFKAMLFVDRLDLSAVPTADDGQSEIGYMLSKPENFRGQAYYRSGASFITHKANFDFNLLPVLDNYCSPEPADDQRVAPTS